VLTRGRRVLQRISPDQQHLARDKKCKTFFFAYAVRIEANLARCPRTAAQTAVFSILAPRSHIPEHCGPYKGVIRYHLGLIVPKPERACRVRIVGPTAHWEEGKRMFFHGTFPHEV
jgi:beta-hydroxylase